jgi:tetratricopeptide (TPR) repeat protein
MGGAGDGRGRVYLTDFGLARSVATGSRYTRTGETLGTPAYMSPEQARGDLAALTPASDVWALGCVLHEALAGRRAFEGDSPAAVIAQVLTGRPAPLHDVPPGPRGLVAGCLARAPAARPPSAAAVGHDCRRVLDGATPRHAAPQGRRPALLAGTAGVALLAAVGWAVLGPEATPPVPSASDPATQATHLVEQALRGRHDAPVAAARLVEQALGLQPHRHAWRLELGLLRWSYQDSDGAVQAWDAVPAGDPAWPRAQFLRALEAFVRRDGSATHERLRSVGDVVGPVGTLIRALDAIATNDAAAAERRLAGVPGWEAAVLRGHLATRRQPADPAAAIRELSTAIDQGLPFAFLWNDRGGQRLALGDLEAAEADVRRALALAPRWAGALFNLARVLERRGDAAAALARYGEAITQDPAFAGAWINRGNLHRDAGRFDAALADYTAALEVAPDEAEALSNRAATYARLGRTAEALQDAERAIVLDPGRADGWVVRGRLRGRQGDDAAALADLGRALAIDPRNFVALEGRALVRGNGGDLDGAIADLQAALAVRPDAPGTHAILGIAYHSKGEFGRAAEALRAHFRLRAPGDPDRADLRALLAECERRAGG